MASSLLSDLIPLLDRTKYNKILNLLAISIPPVNCSLFMKLLISNNLLLQIVKIKSIQSYNSNSINNNNINNNNINNNNVNKNVNNNVNNNKLILLNPNINHKNIPSIITDHLITYNGNIIDYTLNLTYDNYTYEEILKTLLPANVIIPTGFETVGHIAHLNLNEKQLPYKYIIGEVLLDKNKPNIKTVINKTSIITNIFRVFPMELLAGLDDYNTIVHFMNIKFHLNFAEVYWNSRLDTEHRRIIDLIPVNSTLVDIFAGVGPYSLPCAKKGVIVYANDLNPKSYEYLNKNIKLNKISQDNIKTYCLDGRDFWKKVVSTNIDHVVMNLPMTAITFLDCLCGSYTQPMIDEMKHRGRKLPMVHVYCFISSVRDKSFMTKKIETIFGCPIEEIEFHHVRLVSAYVSVQCVSFRLPEYAALNTTDYKPNEDADFLHPEDHDDTYDEKSNEKRESPNLVVVGQKRKIDL